MYQNMYMYIQSSEAEEPKWVIMKYQLYEIMNAIIVYLLARLRSSPLLSVDMPVWYASLPNDSLSSVVFVMVRLTEQYIVPN